MRLVEKHSLEEQDSMSHPLRIAYQICELHCSMVQSKHSNDPIYYLVFAYGLRFSRMCICICIHTYIYIYIYMIYIEQ